MRSSLHISEPPSSAPLRRLTPSQVRKESDIMEPAQSVSSEKDVEVPMEPDAGECIKDSGSPEKPVGMMEAAATGSPRNSEHLENSSVVENAVVDNEHTVTDVDNGVTEQEHEFKEADIHETLAVIAATGKFWHEWDILKRMLSCHLKKVLSEYPEAKKTTEQQTTSLGETVPVLLKRLDYALDSFIEGPPFTLQRLCEILLVARDIYPKLSKLGLALEKNLSVTSTLTRCTDQYPPAAMQKPSIADKSTDGSEVQSNKVENGVNPPTGDNDEIMAEVEDAEADDHMTIDIETFEEIVRSSETNAESTGQS